MSFSSYKPNGLLSQKDRCIRYTYINIPCELYVTCLVAQMVKNLPTMWETCVLSVDWEDLLEKGMATHSSILAWRIPWTEKPSGLHIPRGHKESDTTEQLTLSLFRLAKHRKSGQGRCGDLVDPHSHPGEFRHSWWCDIYL